MLEKYFFFVQFLTGKRKKVAIILKHIRFASFLTIHLYFQKATISIG